MLVGKLSDIPAWGDSGGKIKGGDRIGSQNELRKTHGLLKRKWSYEKGWKNQSSRIMPFVGPQRKAQLRHEEAGRM